MSTVLALAASGPAIPLHTAVKYVAAAYLVFLAIVLVYVAIMATRLRHTERDLVELRRELEARRAEAEAEPEIAEFADANPAPSSAEAELPGVGRP
jgi:flagellar biosynthesis/type III secretory pathway M-ring protein FliF/YscJ